MDVKTKNNSQRLRAPTQATPSGAPRRPATGHPAPFSAAQDGQDKRPPDAGHLLTAPKKSSPLSPPRPVNKAAQATLDAAVAYLYDAADPHTFEPQDKPVVRQALQSLQQDGLDVKFVAHLVADDVQREADAAYEKSRIGKGPPTAAETWDFSDMGHRSFADLSALNVLRLMVEHAQALQAKEVVLPGRPDKKSAAQRRPSRGNPQAAASKAASTTQRSTGRSGKPKDV